VLSKRWTHIYVLDTEFVAPDGEQQIPVSVCAKGFRQARDIRMFLDSPKACPFVGIDSETTLFIGYNLAAEYHTFLALGWPLPKYSIDMMFEYKNITCGVWRGKESLWEIGWGLEDAVRELGGSPAAYWISDKTQMQRYILRYGIKAPDGTLETVTGPDGSELFKDWDGTVQVLDRTSPFFKQWYLTPRTQEEHEKLILDYNMEDCVATHFVAQQIVTMTDAGYDEEQALHRGDFAKATAYFEYNGLPIDVERFHTIKDNAKFLQIHIAQEIEKEHNYGVFVIEGKEHLKNKPHPVFKMKNFMAMLDKMGITVGKRGCMWEATDSGQPYLDDDYFGQQCLVYPDLQPLRQAKKSIKSLGLFNTQLGKDGMNRYTLFPFGTVTSRSNPKATEFMLSRPHWLRMLLRAKRGYALVTADITGAEDWLAAGFSGDEKLMALYSSGLDGYMEFAAVTGAVPPGTKRDKGNPELEKIRAQHKVAKLAIQYGVKENTLAKQLGVPVWKAGQIINAHKEAYSVYWQWVDDQAELAKERGYVITDYGWRQDITHMNENAILNYPQQAGCAELLRLACTLLMDEGWGFTFGAPHHDALYLHVPIERAEECAGAVEQAFIEAGKSLMGSKDDPTFSERFPLRIKAKITSYPEHYYDADGKGIWNIVCRYFEWEEFAVLKRSEVPPCTKNFGESEHSLQPSAIGVGVTLLSAVG
jgi:hypothetical protein